MKRCILTTLIFLLMALHLYGKNSRYIFKGFRLYDTITISFIGDIMQHGPQLSSALKMGGGKSYNYSNAFRYLRPYFEEADYMIGNMEFTVGSKPYSGYPMFSAPKEIALEAKESGIDLFLMANNHIVDKGEKGLELTLNCYDEIQIPRLGVYRDSDEEERENPIIVDIRGVRFALFNFTYGTNGIAVPKPFVVCAQDSAQIKRVIARAKEQNAEFIIALPHWGEEYHLKPSATQKRFAKMLFREGVDAIVGGHPHVPQTAYSYINPTLEKLNCIFYSLGNFISNQSNPPYTQVGMFVKLRFVRNILTGETFMIQPEYQYTWCFRKGELLEDYTVVPIEYFLKQLDEELEYVRSLSLQQKNSIEKMKRVYKYILDQRLINLTEDADNKRFTPIIEMAA